MPFGPCYIPYTVCLTFQDLKLSQAGHTLKSLLQAVRLSSNTVFVAIFLCCPMDLAALSVFVTRLAVTFGLRQQRLQCRSCKGSCQGPSCSSTVLAGKHPVIFWTALRTMPALSCDNLPSVWSYRMHTHHHGFTSFSQHENYCQLQYLFLVGACSNFCSLALDLINCSWLFYWRPSCCQSQQGVHTLCRLLLMKRTRSQTGEYLADAPCVLAEGRLASWRSRLNLL